MAVSSTPSFLTQSVFTVTVTMKSGKITVKGSRGSITKDLSHLQVEMRLMDKTENDKKVKAIRIRMWFGQYKQKCQVKTVHTLLSNMIKGVREVSALFLAGVSIRFGSVSWVSLSVLFLQRVN